VDAERKVVLEEIAMRDDDPSDLVHDLFSDTYYGDTAIGRPILGTVKSISDMSRATVFNYYKKKYLPQDLVVAVSGNIKHKRVVAMVEDALSRDNFLQQSATPAIRPSTPIKNSKQQSVGLLHKKSEQAHMFYGLEGVARADQRRFAMGVLSAALGGGMSSRLFQEIREKRGLAYSVYSYAQQFAGSGTLGFYAGCNPAKALEVVSIMRDVLADVVAHGLTHEEIERAKGAVRGSLVLSQEDTGSRMSRIGKNEIVYGQVMDFDDILKEISRVSAADISEIASEFLVKTPTLALVGPFKSESKFEKVLTK
jgi:predicted Zn-dependent peptidase